MKDYIVEKDFIIDEYRCVILGLRAGHRCGYISLNNDHPMYNKEYMDIGIDVHGGMTYGGISNQYPVETDEKYHWIGFDCIHLHDGQDMELMKSFEKDGEINRYIEISKDRGTYMYGNEVRSTEYVEKELIYAVEQLKNIKEDFVTIKEELNE